MFNKYKVYLLYIALIGTLSYASLLKIKNINIAAQLQVCNANYSALQEKVKIANEMQANQERQLRLREQEATQARVESLKRKDLIMQTEIKNGCEGANQFMIKQALQLYR